MKSVDRTYAYVERPSERVDLDRRYRQIGISALAAALRYRGESKNPAYAPTAPKHHRLATDAAA